MRAFYVLCVILAGCAAPVPPPAVKTSRAGGIAAECRLLAEASARLPNPPTDILTGCPGYESYRDQMPLKAQTAALRRANAAVIPPHVAALAPQGPRIYRRMITRGVPESLAIELSAGESFRAATFR